MATRTLIEITTERLRLVALPAAGRADVEDALGIELPGDWPSRDVRPLLAWYGRALGADPGLVGFGPWLALDARGRLAGDVGLKGRPDDEGTVEIGYGMRRSRRGRGYATEAARALVAWALEQDGVRRVVATCEAGNVASIRVLEKIGMRRTDEAKGLVRWSTHPDGLNRRV